MRVIRLSDEFINLTVNYAILYVKTWRYRVDRILEKKDEEYSHIILYDYDVNDRAARRNLNKVYDWRAKQYELIQKSANELDIFIDKMRNYVFTERDIGYKTIFNFRERSITKVPGPVPNDVTVSVIGYTTEFGFGNMTDTAELKTVNPTFTGWYDI